MSSSAPPTPPAADNDLAHRLADGAGRTGDHHGFARLRLADLAMLYR